MLYTIYKTTNKINGKIYIGAHRTENIDDLYLGSGKALKNSIKKHGLENFEKEIIFIFDNPDEMYQKESELVNEDFVKRKDTYNMKIGGFGGWDHVDSKGKIVTPDTRRKMSAVKKIAQVGQNNTFYGKSHSDETKTKISESSKLRAKGIYEARMETGNHPNASATCPHCQKVGQRRALLRWHFDNCKSKINI